MAPIAATSRAWRYSAAPGRQHPSEKTMAEKQQQSRRTLIKGAGTALRRRARPCCCAWIASTPPFDRLRRELAIVIVGHHLDLALALSDRTVVLETGRVTHTGPSQGRSQDLDLRRKTLRL